MPITKKQIVSDKMNASAAYKPSSVEDDHLSRPTVTGRLLRLRRAWRAAICALIPILRQVGFTSRTSRQAAGELLPRLSILTCTA